MTAPLLIAGGSHTLALVGQTMSVAIGEPPVVRPVEGDEGLRALHGPWPRPDYYWESLIGLVETQAVAIFWGSSWNTAKPCIAKICVSNPPPLLAR